MFEFEEVDRDIIKKGVGFDCVIKVNQVEDDRNLMGLYYVTAVSEKHTKQ